MSRILSEEEHHEEAQSFIPSCTLSQKVLDD